MTYYAIDSSKIAAETFDSEVVIVNLENGHYYVLEGTASTAWQLIAAGLSFDEVTDALGNLYRGTPSKIEVAVKTFTQELIQNNLLSPIDTAPEPHDTAILEQLSKGEPVESFEPPSMFKYTEMENLIQMDPIREVDDSGWPKQRNFSKKKK